MLCYAKITSQTWSQSILSQDGSEDKLHTQYQGSELSAEGRCSTEEEELLYGGGGETDSLDRNSDN